MRRCRLILHVCVCVCVCDACTHDAIQRCGIYVCIYNLCMHLCIYVCMYVPMFHVCKCCECCRVDIYTCMQAFTVGTQPQGACKPGTQRSCTHARTYIHIHTHKHPTRYRSMSSMPSILGAQAPASQQQQALHPSRSEGQTVRFGSPASPGVRPSTP
jgi:hypothetical protein